MDPEPPKNFPPPPMFSSPGIQPEESITVKPGNHDRGWNDPPVFNVEMNTRGKAVPTKLNKRVAFPLSSGGPVGNGMGIGGGIDMSEGNKIFPVTNDIPPPPSIVPANFVFNPSPTLPETNCNFDYGNHMEPQTQTQNESKDLNLDVTKESVMSTLTVTFESVALEPKAKEEIKKRLDIFESSWDTFTDEIKHKIGRLCQCLEEKNYKAAEQLQMSLGSDYVTQCSPWIMAVKNIIRAKHEHE